MIVSNSNVLDFNTGLLQIGILTEFEVQIGIAGHGIHHGLNETGHLNLTRHFKLKRIFMFRCETLRIGKNIPLTVCAGRGGVLRTSAGRWCWQCI